MSRRRKIEQLKELAGRVERGESLSAAERFIAYLGVLEVRERIDRASRACGLSVRMSPHLSRLSEAVGGSRVSGGV